MVLLDYLFNYFNIDGFLTNIIHDDLNGNFKKECTNKAMAIQKIVMEDIAYKAFSALGFATFKLKAECEISDITWGDKKSYEGFMDYYKEHKEEIEKEIDKALNGDYWFSTWR